MTFGQRLKQLRVKAKLTQSDLGKKINLSKSNISKYESDDIEPNMQTIKDIARLFNCSIDCLLDSGYRSDLKALEVGEDQEGLLNQEIDDLSDESKKELEKYIQLLKLKDGMDKSKDGQSSTLEKEA